MKFLVYKFLGRCNNLASTKNIEMLISHKDDKFSKSVFNLIPRINEDECRIYGSYELINSFNEIDNEKIDYSLSLENVKYSRVINNDLELSLFIQEKNEELIVETIYETNRKLLDKFDLSKYFIYCLNNNRQDLAIINFTEMLITNKDKLFQFRTVKNKGKNYLRSITTNIYKNYDNHIALYLMLTSCHKYAKVHNTYFRVNSSIITDSNLMVNLLLDNVIETKVNDLTLKVGVRMSNNEISEGSMSMSFYYNAMNQNGEGFNAIADKVFSISHVNKTEKIEIKIDHLSKLNNYTDEIVKNLEIVNVSKQLSPNEIYEIFENFIHKADASKLQKKSFKKLQNDIANQTLNLISLFNKIDTLIEESDIDKKLIINKMFNDYIKYKANKI